MGSWGPSRRAFRYLSHTCDEIWELFIWSFYIGWPIVARVNLSGFDQSYPNAVAGKLGSKVRTSWKLEKVEKLSTGNITPSQHVRSQTSR